MKRLRFSAGVVLLLVLAGCDNMQHQPAGPDDSRGTDARTSVPPPPEHSIPRLAETEGAFPVGVKMPVDLALLARGRDCHEVFCAPCHGSDGFGRGMVVRRGFPAPPSYHDERLRSISDDELYRVIAEGSGRMLAMADRLAEKDRWAVVAYVRALQLSQHASLAELSDPERRGLEEQR